MKKLLFVLFLIMSMLSFLYGIMVMLGGTGTFFFVIWIMIAIALTGLAFLVKFDVFKKIPKPVRVIGLITGSLGVLVLLFVMGLVLSGFTQTGKDNLDVIIVLGAQVHKTRPSVVLQYRLDKAVEYLNDNPNTICIVSGGQGPDEPFSEGYGMSEYLKNKGIDESRIIIEDKSTSTKENIIYSRRFIEDGASVGIVTNNFHMYRALKVAKKQGLENASGIAAYSVWTFLPNNVLREVFGVIKYFIFGEI